MQNRLLSAKATLPDYDRAALAARMVHLGFGAFHRAHQGVYTDILAAEQHSDWGYYEVNLIGGEQQIADLKQQDNLYTVAEMSAYRGGDVGGSLDGACGGRRQSGVACPG